MMKRGVVKINTRKIQLSNLIAFIGSLFVLSIPMMPVFTKIGYTLLGGASFFLLVLYYIRNKKISFTNFELMEMVFTGFMIISLIYSPNFKDSFGHIKGNIRNILFCFIAVRCLDINNCKKNEDFSNTAYYKFFNIFSWGTILISIYTLIVEPSKNGYYVRLGRYVFDGEYGTYMMYSFNLIIAFGWMMYRFFNENAKIKKFSLLVVLVFLFYCSLLSGTKKCIIAIVLFMLIYIIIKNKRKLHKLMAISAIVVIMGIGLFSLIMNNRTLYLSIGRRFESFFSYFDEDSNADVDGSTLQRASFRKMGLKYFLNHMIFGNGIASFKNLYNRDYGVYLYSHNNFIEILCNLGIIGFCIYYGWQLKIIISLKRNVGSFDAEDINIFFIIIMIVFLILDYGTVSYDKIQYLVTFDVIDYYLLKERGGKNEI